MKTVLKCVVSGAAALTLACGGGGSKSGPDISYTGAKTVVTIDESNVGSMTSMASSTAQSFAGDTYGGGVLKTGAAARTDLRATTNKALSLLAAARRGSAVALTGVTGSVSAWFFVGGGVGGMTMPWLVGQFFEKSGPQVTMIAVLVCLLADLVVLAALLRSAGQPVPVEA